MDLMTRRRALLSKKRPRLPSAYQEVEYLESTGTQYIDINMITTSPWSIKVGLSLTSIDDITLVAGSYRAGGLGFTDRRNYLRVNADGQVNVQINQSAATVVYGSVLQTNQFYAIEGYIQNNPILVVDDQSYSATGTFRSNGISPYLFASHNRMEPSGTETYSNPMTGKIYYAEFYVSGNLRRKLIPCYRKQDSKPGMYDLVLGVFYTNSGTGDFAVGADVNY